MLTLIITANFPKIGRNTNFMFKDLWAKVLCFFIQNLIMPRVAKGEAHFSLTKYENSFGKTKCYLIKETWKISPIRTEATQSHTLAVQLNIYLVQQTVRSE
jgi:hypothetical protein